MLKAAKARPHCAAHAARPRRRGDRVTDCAAVRGEQRGRHITDPALEPDAVVPASFDAPSPEHYGTQTEALLLRDALLLSLRRGAGPFRSAGRIGFEPRAYQLVPLLMALSLPWYAS